MDGAEGAVRLTPGSGMTVRLAKAPRPEVRYPAASGLAERDPDTAASARRALDELEQLAHEGFAPLLP